MALGLSSFDLLSISLTGLYLRQTSLFLPYLDSLSQLPQFWSAGCYQSVQVWSPEGYTFRHPSSRVELCWCWDLRWAPISFITTRSRPQSKPGLSFAKTQNSFSPTFYSPLGDYPSSPELLCMLRPSPQTSKSMKQISLNLRAIWLP